MGKTTLTHFNMTRFNRRHHVSPNRSIFVGFFVGFVGRSVMPKRARELGALELGRLHDDGLHAVGGVPGLHLQINGPAKSWILRATVGVKRRDIGLAQVCHFSVHFPTSSAADPHGCSGSF